MTPDTAPATPVPAELKPRLDFALDAASEAGRLILGYFRQAGLPVELKADRSPVTAADRGAETLIRDALARSFPDDGFLGEESGETESRNGYRWIVDPLDGTKSFVHGVPLFGTLIGVEFGGRMVAGVCRLPVLNEVVYAALGRGAWWQIGGDPPRPARVSGVSRLSEALQCFTTVTGFTTVGRPEVFETLCRETRLSRGWGDCYGHVLVATGRADLIVEPQMNPWDAAALVPILEEAGGHYLDWSGRASITSGCGLSVNGALREAVLEIVRR
ncbi:MAG TPA: inositol monophosphatase family protein [Planctomycetaceae bacterium]|nr:inositol monophosphatase family protein [Planctomycetaceae bacterium]